MSGPQSYWRPRGNPTWYRRQKVWIERILYFICPITDELIIRWLFIIWPALWVAYSRGKAASLSNVLLNTLEEMCYNICMITKKTIIIAKAYNNCGAPTCHWSGKQIMKLAGAKWRVGAQCSRVALGKTDKHIWGAVWDIIQNKHVHTHMKPNLFTNILKTLHTSEKLLHTQLKHSHTNNWKIIHSHTQRKSLHKN